VGACATQRKPQYEQQKKKKVERAIATKDGQNLPKKETNLHRWRQAGGAHDAIPHVSKN